MLVLGAEVVEVVQTHALVLACVRSSVCCVCCMPCPSLRSPTCTHAPLSCRQRHEGVVTEKGSGAADAPSNSQKSVPSARGIWSKCPALRARFAPQLARQPGKGDAPPDSQHGTAPAPIPFAPARRRGHVVRARTVHVPCLLAQSVLLAEDIPLCKKHLWT